MNFKKLRGVNRSYQDQGEIFFTCRNYAKQPEAVKEKIRRMCTEIGGAYKDALFAVMTRDVSLEWVAQHYFVTQAQLYRFRKKFYERW